VAASLGMAMIPCAFILYWRLCGCCEFVNTNENDIAIWKPRKECNFYTKVY